MTFTQKQLEEMFAEMAKKIDELEAERKRDKKIISSLKRKRASKQSKESEEESGDEMVVSEEDEELVVERKWQAPVNYAAAEPSHKGLLKHGDLMAVIGDRAELLEELREDKKKQEEFRKLEAEIKDDVVEYLNQFLFFIADRDIYGEEQYDDIKHEKRVVYRKNFGQLVTAFKSFEGHLKSWNGSEWRRVYETMTLDPSKTGDLIGPSGFSKYNVWDGFKLGPDTKYKGDYMEATQAMRNHILHVLCRGDEAVNEWVLKWLACNLQHPEFKIGVAIMVKGEMGAGKGHVPTIMGKIMGEKYYFHAKKTTDVYGQFASPNALSTMFMFADELGYAGNHTQADELKCMIDAPKKTIENKGKDKFEVDCFMNMWFATNHKFFLAAGGAERRGAVLHALNEYMGNGERQRKYHTAVARTPPEAFAEFLYQYDLGDFLETCRAQCPVTDGLRDQKMRNLSVLDEWWNWCLSNQLLYKGVHKPPQQDPDAEHMHWSFPELPDFEKLYKSMREYNKDQPRKYHADMPTFEIFKADFKDLIPKLVETRPGTGRNRVRVYKMPSLEACRKEWCKLKCDEKWFEQADEDLAVAESVAGHNLGYVSEFKAMDMTVPEEPKEPIPVVERMVAVEPVVVAEKVVYETGSVASDAQAVLSDIAFPKDAWYDKWLRLRKILNKEGIMYNPTSFEIPLLLTEIDELKREYPTPKDQTAFQTYRQEDPAPAASSSSSSSFVASRGIPQVVRHKMPMNYNPNKTSELVIDCAMIYDPNCKFKRVDI